MKSVYKAISLFIASSFLFASHSISFASPLPTLPIKNFSSDCFKFEKSPVLKSGQLFKGSTWNDPSVLWDNNQFVMYASSDHDFDEKIEIYRLTSQDGRSWNLSPNTPVLSASQTAWDSQAVETPSVVKFNNIYHMFYTGYDGDLTEIKKYKIGHAISKDGITWEKIVEPILKPTAPNKFFPNMAFDQYVVAEPGATVFNGELYLFFTAIGGDKEVNNILQTIGVIKSQDGKTWTAPELSLRPNQTIFSRDNNFKGFSTPQPAVINGDLHLFIDIVTESPYQQIGLYHVWSKNAGQNWIEDSAAFLMRDNIEWASDNLVSPSVLSLKDDIHIWFAGHSGFNLGIGHGFCAH